MRSRLNLIAVGGVALGCLLFSRATLAQDGGTTVPSCSDTTMFPNPVYLAGSTAYQPTARVFAAKLSQLTGADQMTIIYQNGFGSCDGVGSVLSGANLTGQAQAIYVANANFATNPIPGNVTATNCSLDTGTPHPVDVGVSDIFWKNCPSISAQPADVKDFQGPAQAMIFITPIASGNVASTFTQMSAEMAQLIWGCGPAGMVTPFDDPMGIYQRNSGSGTQGIVAKAINVPATAFFTYNIPATATTPAFTNQNTTGGAMLNSLAAYVAMSGKTPDKAIGFVAGDAFDGARAAVNPVAFQGFHQTKAYYADSTKDSKDRKNLRDGHYVVWGPEHFYARVDTNGVPTSAAAAKFIGSQNGTMYQTSFAPYDYIQLQALAGVVPQCAMKVTRSDDGGPVKANVVSDPCGCYYEKTRTGTTSCTACPTGNECTGGTSCHHGYCE